MYSAFESLTVINGMTETGWRDELREAMNQRREILLLLAAADEQNRAEVNQWCAENAYRQPETLSESEWSAYKDKLSLSGYAAKEQGINRNFAYRLRPDR